MRKNLIFVMAFGLICLLVFIGFFCYSHTQHSPNFDTSQFDHTTHTWSEWTTVEQPTCVSNGKAQRVCVCGKKERKELPVTEHTGGEWIIDQKATFEQNGKKHQLCSVCRTNLHEAVIPALSLTVLPAITDEFQNELRPNYALGNCRKLEGNPVVVLLFIDDNESSWSKKEILTFTQKHILVGLDYLEANAKTWGVDLDFIVESYSTPLSGFELKYEGTVIKNLLINGSSKDVLDQAAVDIGFQSNWELYSYYKEKYPNDDIIFLNFLNKSGKSYARHAISTGYFEYSEHCVIFADYLGYFFHSRPNGSRASTVAHEILHLFGAEDFYSSTSREKIAEQTYPNDIMLHQYDDIESNKIGDCTAFSIGWTNTTPRVCFRAEWWK